jgi:hypothetical protein
LDAEDRPVGEEIVAAKQLEPPPGVPLIEFLTYISNNYTIFTPPEPTVSLNLNGGFAAVVSLSSFLGKVTTAHSNGLSGSKETEPD